MPDSTKIAIARVEEKLKAVILNTACLPDLAKTVAEHGKTIEAVEKNTTCLPTLCVTVGEHGEAINNLKGAPRMVALVISVILSVLAAILAWTKH